MVHDRKKPYNLVCHAYEKINLACFVAEKQLLCTQARKYALPQYSIETLRVVDQIAATKIPCLFLVVLLELENLISEVIMKSTLLGA